MERSQHLRQMERQALEARARRAQPRGQSHEGPPVRPTGTEPFAIRETGVFDDITDLGIDGFMYTGGDDGGFRTGQ